ncbi:MAG: hypothetical protein K8H74_18020 [Notoacmeibacter sp.]|nr:hypothetical protein [Notoacmeibacter sp.]
MDMILSEILAEIATEMTRAATSKSPTPPATIEAWRDQLAVMAEMAERQEAELRSARPLLAAAMERLSNQGGTVQ